MRVLSVLPAAAIALSTVFVAATASAQAPFSVRGQASDVPESPAPQVQQRLAQDEANTVAPTAPRTTLQPAAPVAAPFDINEDGASPVVPDDRDEEEFSRPSTTVSPLAGGRRPGAVVPVEAVSFEQRRALNQLLKDDTTDVRELRVTLENSDDWVDSVVDRPIVPYRTLRLDGEIAFSSWTVFLNAAEAARGGNLSIAFTNSVLVLPEASRLRVFLNGRLIAETAIDSPDRTKVIALPVSSDLLRPGENAIRLEAEMRHRIDCSINATYELWTRIDTRLTGFSFGGGRIPLIGLADIPAVGVATNGATRLRVVQPMGNSPINMDRMLRAVQAAALRGRFIQPLVEVAPDLSSAMPEPGVLNIVIGTYDMVSALTNAVPSDGQVGPVAAMVDNPRIGPTVVITGPNQRAVDTALARFDAPALPNQPRSAIVATPPWLVPDGVRVNGADTVSLRQAGVETINFSGRRFKTHFNVTLPPDFYAAAYGEAQLLLDAAYASDVEPGSRLSVLVNGVLSTAISFTSSKGEVIEDFPIALVMENFRPGINTVEIVADLETETDAVCLPGGTVPGRDRFALFSSTELAFPDFARIGQLPNLASFATNGFPYQLSDSPVRVRIGGTAADTVGAAGTLIARVAVSRGASFPTEVVDQAGPFAGEGVIIVAPLNEVSNLALETTGAARAIPSNWLQPYPTSTGAEPEGLERYDNVLRRLRQQLRQEEVRLDRNVAAADENALRDVSVDQRGETQRSQERWFDEVTNDNGISRLFSNLFQSVKNAVNFNVSLGDSDRLASMPLISDRSTLMLAQAPAPDNSDTAWTLVTAPTAGLLSASLASLSAPGEWRRIGGRITAYQLDDSQVQTVPVEQVSYLATLPLSFTNLRLIAANWFSINNGIYAIALILVAIVLGVVTWALVTPLGRRG